MDMFDDDLKGLIRDIEERYWVPAMQTPFANLKELSGSATTDCPALQPILAAFTANLGAAQQLLEFPYMLIAPHLPEVRRISATGLGKAGGPEAQVTEEAIALLSAVLKGVGRDFSKRRESQLLMHQACVLIWAAFETYCKEVFIASLNQKPSLFAVIQGTQVLRERFGIQASSWPALLEKHDYDLQGKLGRIIARDRDFSSGQLIKDLFPVLFEGMGPEFPEWLTQSDALWVLAQRRHLVAHRCGIVDKEYLDKTGDKVQVIGQSLKLRGSDMAEAMGKAAAFAIILYAQARCCWPRF